MGFVQYLFSDFDYQLRSDVIYGVVLQNSNIALRIFRNQRRQQVVSKLRSIMNSFQRMQKVSTTHIFLNFQTERSLMFK